MSGGRDWIVVPRRTTPDRAALLFEISSAAPALGSLAHPWLGMQVRPSASIDSNHLKAL
jgi:hypothetical protein